jgi:hypothetical protein
MTTVLTPGGPIPQRTLFAMARLSAVEAHNELDDAAAWLDSETIGGRLPAVAALARLNAIQKLARAADLINEAAADLDSATEYYRRTLR